MNPDFRLNMNLMKMSGSCFFAFVIDLKRRVMIATVQQWGNEQGIVFPGHILRNLNLHIGDSVEVNIINEKIVIESVSIKYPKYNIRELVSRMPEDYHPEETDWGKPMGKEVW